MTTWFAMIEPWFRSRGRAFLLARRCPPLAVADLSFCIAKLVADTVEKGIFRNLEATLIQDRKPTRNLDSKIHMAGFARFKF
jgi:hypothetical protein